MRKTWRHLILCLYFKPIKFPYPINTGYAIDTCEELQADSAGSGGSKDSVSLEAWERIWAHKKLMTPLHQTNNCQEDHGGDAAMEAGV
jgi:hypothetical protein